MRQFLPLLVLLFTIHAEAQYGVPDPSFGIGGQVILPSGNPSSTSCNAVAQAPDGKLVIAGGVYQAGAYSWAVSRLLTDGALDTTFADSGFAILPIGAGYSNATAVVVQPDGKVVAAGVSEVGTNTAFTLVRCNIDGSLDTTFDQDGILIALFDGIYSCTANAIALQPDGKIVAAGEYEGISNYYAAMMRINTDGSLDSTFSADGQWQSGYGTNHSINAIALQPDGKILYAGRKLNGTYDEVMLGRVTDTGTSDGQVQLNAFSTSDVAYGVTLQPDGKIIACGTASGTYWTGRYNADLSTDFTFGLGGWISDSFSLNHHVARSCHVLPSGDILVSGNAAQFTSTCYQTNGTLQTAFGNGGYLSFNFPSPPAHTARAGILQADGKLVVVGDQATNFLIARGLLDFNVGVLEFGSTDANIVVYPNPMQDQAVMRYSLEKDERITITLRDVEGRAVRTLVDQHASPSGRHEQVIDLSQLSGGVYFVELDNGQGRTCVRVSKP